MASRKRVGSQNNGPKCDNCRGCRNTVRDDDISGIKCEKCSKWFHGACVSLTVDEVVWMGNKKNCLLICDSCINSTVFESEAKMNSFIEKHENNFLNETMQKIYLKIKITVLKIIEESLPSHFSEVIEKVFCAKLPMYKESMSSTSVVKKPIDTTNQCIINGIYESGSTFLSQFESDTKIIEDVIDKLRVKSEGNIKEACRPGKHKNPDADERRQCRPLLISTDNPYFIEKSFPGSHYLKDFRLTVYSKKFLTRGERELEKKLQTKRYNMINGEKIELIFESKSYNCFTKAKSLISVKQLSD